MELPRLEPLFQKYQDRGLSIIAVEGTGDRTGAMKFIEENKLTYTFLQNLEGEEEVVRKVYGVTGYPTSYLLDAQGKIVFAHLDFNEGDEEKIEKEIKTLLGS